ncbi:hypothetical protein COUCH_00455 [Couchioplanes caeruleus]|uniref:hypothetical protein n=1 Tax=Couchioplanes caeruleus TaxID=56438 RepID=UPI0020C0E8CC|nr:hypothetical protein [Couchioplanes caeruleus]UQU64874.1 hypothetical protein COUCH_00455 [Couchioplanes caeruleus]
MQLVKILDVLEGLFVASEHPEIVEISRYGQTDAVAGVPPYAGVRVKYPSGATAMLWGSNEPGGVPVPVPEVMPTVARRAPRIAIFAAQLLDVARPSIFRSWTLLAFPSLGLESERGTMPFGLSIVGADGTTTQLRATATGGDVRDPAEDPYPDYRIPEGVKEWHPVVNAQPAVPA